jgi:hypothetical protein
MPPCFKCGKDITFNKNIRSKTGKQIPLWPDERDAHGHDEQGEAIRQPLPPQQTQDYQQHQEQKSYFTKTQPQSTSNESQGGSYMDTKRLRVMVEELVTKTNGFEETLTALYQLEKSNNGMLGELMQLFKVTDPKPAADLYKAMQHTQQEALKDDEYRPDKVKGWNSVIESPDKINPARAVEDDL